MAQDKRYMKKGKYYMLRKALLVIVIFSSILNANENEILGYWGFSSSGGLAIFGSIKISKEYIEWGTLKNTTYQKMDKKYPCKAEYTLQIGEFNDYILLLKNKNCLYSEMINGSQSKEFASFEINILNEAEAIISDYNDKGHLNGKGLMNKINYRLNK